MMIMMMIPQRLFDCCSCVSVRESVRVSVKMIARGAARCTVAPDACVSGVSY